jgi:hypothetical protein
MKMNLKAIKYRSLSSYMLEYLRTCLSNHPRCLSVSSPNNFGKSTLLRELAQPPSVPDKLLLIYIDFNLRADDSTQAFYELILRQLLQVFRDNRLPVEKLENFYESLICSISSPFSLGRSFLVAMAEALQIVAAQKTSLVLLIDEFDQPLQYGVPHAKEHFCTLSFLSTYTAQF